MPTPTVAPPRFVQRPEPLYKAREGESLEIPCASVGFPKPEQSLRRLGNFPAAVERRLTLPEADAARFGIRRLSGADTGEYICISENAGGRVETAFTLEVLTRPRFVSDSAWSARVGVRPGGDLVLDCEAEANPAPAYSWYFNDRWLNNRTEAQLRLASAVLADAGVYQCEAANAVGLVSRRVQLFVGSRPIVHSDISTTAGPPPVSTADGVDGVSIVSTDNPDSRPNFSLLVFAVVVSATSCVLLTTLLWCVVFVFLRRKSRRMKRSLSQRLEDQARAHREQMYRSEPALSGLSRQPSLLQQQPQPQQQQQQPPQQQRMPLMVSSMMALPHSKSGDLLLLAGGLPAASGPAPPIPPFHLPQQTQQQQPQLQMPADQLNLCQHKQQRLSRYANGNGNSAHRSEPDLIVNGGSMVAIGNGNSRFPLLQQQRSCQPIQLSQFAQQQQQKQQQQKQQQPPTETSDYNTGSASSGDSVEHLRCHGYDSHGYCLNSHQRLQQLQEQQLMMQQQQQQHSQQPLLTSWCSGRHAQRVLLQQQLSYQYQQQQQQQQQQQTPVCSTFTGQKSPSSTEFDSGCEPSGSSLARPRSSRSLLLTSGGGGPSVVTVQETVT